MSSKFSWLKASKGSQGTPTASSDDLPPSYNDAVASSSSSSPAPIRQPPTNQSQPPKPQPPLPQVPSPLQQVPSPLSTSELRPQPQPQANSIPSQFPPAFSLYSAGFKSMVIAEHQNAPLYAVEFHAGYSGRPNVELFSGPDPSRFPVLAGLDFSMTGSSMTAMVPPMPGRGPETCNVRIECGGLWRRTYGFFIEVGDIFSPDHVREAYEWRSSFGDVMDVLGGSGQGWKLVRLNRGPPPGVPPNQQFVNGGFMTSEGHEVVAAMSRVNFSGGKKANFQFFGTGTSGLLGQRWAVMVVISALGLYSVDQRRH